VTVHLQHKPLRTLDYHVCADPPYHRLALPVPTGQEVVVNAVGASYTEWEGYLDESTGRAVIGLSYDKLCRDVKPGGRILLADGSITIQVGWAAMLVRCWCLVVNGHRRNTTSLWVEALQCLIGCILLADGSITIQVGGADCLHDDSQVLQSCCKRARRTNRRKWGPCNA
jgi:hypothetical protein